MPIFFREPGWKPLGELEQLQRRMNRLFQNAYGLEGRPWRVKVYPPVNISFAAHRGLTGAGAGG